MNKVGVLIILTILTLTLASAGDYRFQNLTGADLMTIQGTDGFIGIGTATPLYKLDVAGTGRFTGTISAGSTPIVLTGTTGYILEGAITQNTLDDSEIEDNSLTDISLAADSVGDSELIAAPTFSTINTGQGANELYGMDQDVKTTASPEFANLTLTGGIDIGDTGVTLKVKVLTAVVSGQSYGLIAHGLDSTKIRGVSCSFPYSSNVIVTGLVTHPTNLIGYLGNTVSGTMYFTVFYVD